MKKLLSIIVTCVIGVSLTTVAFGEDLLKASEVVSGATKIDFSASRNVYLDSKGRFVAFLVYSKKGVAINRNDFNNDGSGTESVVRIVDLILVKPDLTAMESYLFVSLDKGDLGKEVDANDLTEELLAWLGKGNDFVVYRESSGLGDVGWESAKRVGFLDALFVYGKRYNASFLGLYRNPGFTSLGDYYSYTKSFSKALRGISQVVDLAAGKLSIDAGVDGNNLESCINVAAKGKVAVSLQNDFIFNSLRGFDSYNGKRAISLNVSVAALSEFMNSYDIDSLTKIISAKIKDANVNERASIVVADTQAKESAKIAAKLREDAHATDLKKMESEYRQAKLMLEAKRDADMKKAIIEERKKLYAEDLDKQVVEISSASEEGRRRAQSDALRKLMDATAAGAGKNVYDRLTGQFNGYKEVRIKFNAMRAKEMDSYEKWILVYLQSGRGAAMARVNPSAYADAMEFKPSSDLKVLGDEMDRRARDIRALKSEFESTTRLKLEFALKVIDGELE